MSYTKRWLEYELYGGEKPKPAPPYVPPTCDGCGCDSNGIAMQIIAEKRYCPTCAPRYSGEVTHG